tara:strand:- start:107 stop:829 length:723 start_codon:yes stop_codon:yes gene_type:complete
MDKLNVNTIEPEGGTTTLNVGISGKNVTITDNLKANTLKDAGGNTIFTSDGSGNLSSVNSGFGSAQVLLSTQTASGSASVEFTSGIDGTYKEYVFDFTSMYSSVDGGEINFQVSTDGGSSYGVTATTTVFQALHTESDSVAALTYQAAKDLAQSTSDQKFFYDVGNAADMGSGGILHLFNPASTTYVKNFYAEGSLAASQPGARNAFIAGYFNTTSALDAIIFRPASGTISGKIKMYGMK